MNWLKKEQRIFLEDGNYHFGQTIDKRFDEIFNCILGYSNQYGIDKCNKIVELIKKNILSLSTPQLSNLGREKKGNSKPLSVSCNIVSVGNSIDEIYSSTHEVAMLSKLGAGVGDDFDQLPSKGTLLENGMYTNSIIDWIETVIDASQKVSQGGVRRGFATPFMNIENVEFYDLLKKINKKNTDKSILIDNTIGVKIFDNFIRSLEKDKENQKKWISLLKARQETGNIYISFLDNMNKNASKVYSKLGLSINTSNICQEFLQPVINDHTPSCVLAALNLNYWDIIENDPDIIECAIYFLNIVTDEYIKDTLNIPGLQKARNSAIECRNIGLGTLGFHDLLQSKGFAFGDVGSRTLNKKIYSLIQKHSIIATKKLADLHEPCFYAKKAGLNYRNASLNMIAPNKSTSFISGISSLGIEPLFSNIFVKKLAKINYTFKNKYLEILLESIGKNTNGVWESIVKNLGSVQHLDFLTQEQKNIFLTFNEISPKDIIDLASDRQVYIDMGQSLNLMNRPNYTNKDLHEIHKYAWEKGIKTLYYFYPQAHATIEKEGKKWDSCISCAD